MALIAKRTKVSMDAITAQKCSHITGSLYAGEALDAGAPCYIATDGKVYMCVGGNSAKNTVDGWTPIAYNSGEAVALHGRGVRFGYSAGLLTPGTSYYLSTTKGRLDTAGQGTELPVARSIDGSDIYTRSGV